ncbi:hypothetical protein WDU94_002129 [Cyamophila willieti]
MTKPKLPPTSQTPKNNFSTSNNDIKSRLRSKTNKTTNDSDKTSEIPKKRVSFSSQYNSRVPDTKSNTAKKLTSKALKTKKFVNSKETNPKETLKVTKHKENLTVTKHKETPNAAKPRSVQKHRANNSTPSNHQATSRPTNPNKTQAATQIASRAPNPTNDSVSIYDLAIDGPGSSHDTGAPVSYTQADWDTMKEGLLNKILQQEIELNELREKVSSYETMLLLLNNDLNKPVDNIPTMTKPPRPPKTDLGNFTCHLIGDSHVRGLAPELSTIFPRTCRTEAVFQPGVGFHGLAEQHTQSPNLVTPAQNDCVVMICGTNDVCCTEWNLIQRALDILIRKFNECKIFCVVGIPFRYDNKKLNFHIKRFNAKLKSYLQSKMSNFHFLDPIKFIKPKDYRVDGLHFNKTGKSKLCKRVKIAVEDKYSGSNPVYNHKLATKVHSPSSPSCENWLLPEPISEGPPVRSSHNNDSIICEDLIDLTDPPLLLAERDESYFTNVMNNTVLFPDLTTNNSNVNVASACQTPYTYSTPSIPNKSSNYYQLTHVSLNVSTITNQLDPGFQNSNQTNHLV